MAFESGKSIPLLLTLAACLTCLSNVKAQAVQPRPTQKDIVEAADASVAPCQTIRAGEPVKEALQLACLRTNVIDDSVSIRNAIIIGFVGGFVKHDDLNHPEVNFALLLHEIHPSIHAQVFANHEGKKALRRVLQFLDTNRDGIITASEKEQASIIIYGHSWGASGGRIGPCIGAARHSGAPDGPNRQRS